MRDGGSDTSPHDLSSFGEADCSLRKMLMIALILLSVAFACTDRHHANRLIDVVAFQCRQHNRNPGDVRS